MITFFLQTKSIRYNHNKVTGLFILLSSLFFIYFFSLYSNDLQNRQENTKKEMELHINKLTIKIRCR